MKKILSCSKYKMIICSLLIIAFFVFSLIALGLDMFGLVKDKGAGFLAFGIFLCLSSFLLWSLNRLACIVWIDEGLIKRKGLICGFYKECPINAIRSVEIKHVFREGDFIYLIDNSTHKYNQARKDSYICFRKTKKNIRFLHMFWLGTIEE